MLISCIRCILETVLDFSEKNKEPDSRFILNPLIINALLSQIKSFIKRTKNKITQSTNALFTLNKPETSFFVFNKTSKTNKN